MGYNEVYFWRQSCLNHGDLNRFFQSKNHSLSRNGKILFSQRKKVPGGWGKTISTHKRVIRGMNLQNFQCFHDSMVWDDVNG